jgi:ornithine cyclodeaminase
VSVRLLTYSEVIRLLPMTECIEVMAQVLKTLAQGGSVLPLRTPIWFPDKRGLLGLMPAYLSEPECAGLKAVTVMPGNHGTEFDSHQGAILLFEVKHGCPLAVIDASSVTAIRTAAVSAVASRVLARENAGDLALLGSGVQAESHLEAMGAVRKLRRVRVWSRSTANARTFAERSQDRCGIEIEVMDSAQEAVQNADLICTTTAAKDPVLLGEWLSPGAHINAVGACIPGARELDTRAVARSRFFVDCRESAHNEAGDFLIPKKEGAIGDEHISGEIGEVLAGRVKGRGSAEEITLFKSLGIAVEDLAAAHYLHRKAEAANAGIALEWGGRRDAPP